MFAWYSTLVLVTVLHFTGLFPLQRLVEHFGALLTTAGLVATLLAIYCYISAHVKGTTLRMSGVVHYDFFMGSELNPRIGDFDIKFFIEIRPGIMLWFLLSLSALAKQYDQHGFVTVPMVLMCFYHMCYANSCYKGEECIPMSMDIIYEKFGWMLSYANMVSVTLAFSFSFFPFSFSLSFFLFLSFSLSLSFSLFSLLTLFSSSLLFLVSNYLTGLGSLYIFFSCIVYAACPSFMASHHLVRFYARNSFIRLLHIRYREQPKGLLPCTQPRSS